MARDVEVQASRERAAHAVILELSNALSAGEDISAADVERAVHRANRGAPTSRQVAKTEVLRRFLAASESDADYLARLGLDETTASQLATALRMKPRRTASGVATVTVVAKPHPCSGSCLFCPSDVRMPKSYLADEPACQRAERALFDPYLQVAARLRALFRMGHDTSKVELIVLGGTWSDYPRDYQIWFAAECFRALNDGVGEVSDTACEARRADYERAGVTCPRIEDAPRESASSKPSPAARARRKRIDTMQAQIDTGALTYNDAVADLYGEDVAWHAASSFQVATFDELDAQHAKNESAAHRCVGLVMETRPDRIDAAGLALMRRLGCTKVQIGVQSTDANVLAKNNRATNPAQIADAFALLRAFGFKIHAHAMANLLGSNPECDKRDYRRLVTDKSYQPDEVKIYPCVLVAGTGLDKRFSDGAWRPYSEDELLDVLACNIADTPPFTRISRMIRDISAHDIKAGNKRANLRQLAEARVEAAGLPIREIRHREIGAHTIDPTELALDEVAYDTSNTRERFLQWVSPDGRIAGFLRLSLPCKDYVRAHAEKLPVASDEAMIREVHVYGAVARFHETGEGAQHLGLGRKLVERACEIAREAGYARINVISAVGTRGYYRALGFSDAGLYQTRQL